MIAQIISALLTLVYVFGTILTIYTIIYVLISLFMDFPNIRIFRRKKHKELLFFDNKKQRKEIGKLGREIRHREGIKGFNTFRNICIVTWMNRLYNLEKGLESSWNSVDFLIGLGLEKPSTEYMMRYIPYQISPDFGITKRQLATLNPHDTLKIVYEKYMELIKKYHMYD